MKRGAHYDIAVIGAGASGLLAAISAAQIGPELRIVIVEKNSEPAKKLYATGNGRCNYMNRYVKPEDFRSAGTEGVPPHAKSLFSGSSAEKMIRFLRELGIEPREEEDGRLYPRSNQAADVVRALLTAVGNAGIEIVCGFDVREISQIEDSCKILSAERDYLYARRVVIATGGKAGIQYGCTGDGYKLAASFGHSVIKPIPALTQLVTRDDISMMVGARVRARIKLLGVMGYGSRLAAEDSGEVQFTRDSLSGICTFNVSRFLRYEEGVSYRAELDLMEEYSDQSVEELLTHRRAGFRNEPVPMLLTGLVPDRVASYISSRAGAKPGRLCASLESSDIKRIARLLKTLSFDITGTKSWKDAQVTCGGVSLSEVDPQSFASARSKYLYLAGELLDVDARCGGFNLSFAFASGMAAGMAAARSL